MIKPVRNRISYVKPVDFIGEKKEKEEEGDLSEMADDEVEEMLRAAQDELILKLSVNSHTSCSSTDYIDPDLHSRFLALKSKKKEDKPRPKPKRVVETPTSTPTPTPDDLMLRFAALKKTSSPPASSSSVFLPGEFGEEDGQGGEDDEVEKLIQWAMDAARLDPSPPSDDEEDEDEAVKR